MRQKKNEDYSLFKFYCLLWRLSYSLYLFLTYFEVHVVAVILTWESTSSVPSGCRRSPVPSSKTSHLLPNSREDESQASSQKGLSLFEGSRHLSVVVVVAAAAAPSFINGGVEFSVGGLASDCNNDDDSNDNNKNDAIQSGYHHFP